MQKLKIFLIVLSIITFVSCSDDDPVSPSEKPVNSVIIEPAEVTFNAIGQNKQFTAKAYDETGGEVSTSLSWASSNEEVVMIGSDGMAEATGLGNANIYVTAGEKSDTAEVKVDLDVVPEIWWVSAKSGDWNEATNWSTGVVPEDDDTVAITLEGNYTVTITSDITISHITLGATTGTQKLATGANLLTIEEGILTGGAELQINGTVKITDKVEWKDGEITGTGTMVIERNAEVHAGSGGDDSQLSLKAKLDNIGVLAIVSGVIININGGTLENSGKVDFQTDDAWLKTFAGGKILNSGDIVKSNGIGDASINSSEEDSFVSNGYINVESGSLHIRGGNLSNVITINEGAELHQSGTTLIRLPFYNRGEGIFEIGGSITLGEQTGDEIKIKNIILDSWQTENSITGPGDLTILNSLLWHAGGINGAGTVMIHGDAILEGTGYKKISERIFEIHRTLETESLLDLILQKGAQLHIMRNAQWTHTGGGNIKKGEGDMQSAIIITDTFTKKGTGSLTVETDFSCAGTMNLNEGVLTVKGAFELQKSGKIVGGSTNTENEVHYRMLQVPEATSALLSGTIEVDADGALAYMSIQGAVIIDSTFNVLIDIDKNNDLIPAERLVFETGRVALNGKLNVNLIGATPPPEGVQYRVVSTMDGTGAFAEITGAEWFTEIREDANGVLLIRN